MPLSDHKIKSAKPRDKAYKLLDAEGLYLEVRPSGKKFWRYRFSIKNKEGMFTPGEYPDVSLAEARVQRKWAKSQAKQGLNPNEVRKKNNSLPEQEEKSLFVNVSKVFLDKQLSRWSGAYVNQYRRIFETDVFPEIGNIPIHLIKPSHCLSIIEKIEERGAPTVASLARLWLSQVFRFAASKLLVESDPTFVLKGAIFKKPVRHNPSLDASELPVFFDRLASYGGYRTTVLALRLLAHTFVRTGELRKAAWIEFNFEEKLWTIPAEMSISD